MNLSDPRLQNAVNAAMNRIKFTVAESADQVVQSLGHSALSAANNKQRETHIGAQFQLRRKLAAFNAGFVDALAEAIRKELEPHSEVRRRDGPTDWQSLSLVDDQQVEALVSSDRLGHAIALDCEWELRELNGYMGSLMRTGRSDKDVNPLRPDIIGKALYRAIEAVSEETEIRKLLSNELGQSLSTAMRTCYAEIVADLRGRGIQPVGLSVLTRGGATSGYSRHGAGDHGSDMDQTLGLPSESAMYGPGHDGVFRSGPGALGSGAMGGANFGGGGIGSWSTGAEGSGGMGLGGENQTGGGSPLTGHSFGPGAGTGGAGLGPASGAGSPDRSGFHSGPGTGGSSYGGSRYGGSHYGGMNSGGNTGGDGGAGHSPRSRNSSAGRLGPSSGGGSGRGRGSGGPGGGTPFGAVDASMMALMRRLAYLGSMEGGFDTAPNNSIHAGEPGVPSFRGSGASDIGSHPSGMMAANVIQAHRDELRQASSGALDHMVIDVVSALFDQVLSDPKVPPQMARQIARLQMPVLRVALGDVTFFSSRRHPVRRFVNRIASLACAFEDFDEDPGKRFLELVRDLVQEIVSGDFDQMEVYDAKLGELEKFIAEQTQKDAEQNSQATTLLGVKEDELRLQQRYRQQLHIALKAVALPDFMHDFLSQVWSQAIVQMSRTDGADSDRTKRMRRTARDLVMSLQPKGAPPQRKAFLMALPQLMKSLNEGLGAIGWHESAKKEFFGKLLPAHAESLKGDTMRELDHNLLVKQLDSIFDTPLPRPEELHVGEAIPVLNDVVMEARFSPEEAEQIGLVEESKVDWDGTVDIEVGADPELTDLDINIDGLPPIEPATPTSGAALIDHIQLGFAYQMHLSEQWQKVRLSYVSPGRAFFVFTRGRKHQQTVSMTSRMLTRMCETGRLRAFENAYLIERATARARKQLSQLKPGLTKH